MKIKYEKCNNSLHADFKNTSLQVFVFLNPKLWEWIPRGHVLPFKIGFGREFGPIVLVTPDHEDSLR